MRTKWQVKSPSSFWPKGLTINNWLCALLFSLGFSCFGGTTAGLDAFVHCGKWFEILSSLVARAAFVVADVIIGLLHNRCSISTFGSRCCWGRSGWSSCRFCWRGGGWCRSSSCCGFCWSGSYWGLRKSCDRCGNQCGCNQSCF